MITAPETNIKLTDEHLAQIQEGENRLTSIEALITITNRNLKVAKLELERTTKDILLQTEKLTALNKECFLIFILTGRCEVDGGSRFNN